MANNFKPETLCVQAGWSPTKGEPRVLPIYQSTTFKYDTSEQMARLFDLEDTIGVTFVSPDASEEEIIAAFRPNTKALFGETISNPSLEVLDIEKFARIAHSQGVPLIVDNTFPTPINCRPFEWGADIVVHSTTKYMDGHATSVGGVIVDSGNFDWEAHAEKYPGLCTPVD